MYTMYHSEVIVAFSPPQEPEVSAGGCVTRWAGSAGQAPQERATADTAGNSEDSQDTGVAQS